MQTQLSRFAQFDRDPATGRYLTAAERQYVAQLAQQYPEAVQRAYDQNLSLAEVGLPVQLPSQAGQIQPQSLQGQVPSSSQQSQWSHDPATGRHLTAVERQQVAQFAQQYPEAVQRAYDQNLSFAQVGLPVTPNFGQGGSVQQFTSQQPQPVWQGAPQMAAPTPQAWQSQQQPGMLPVQQSVQQPFQQPIQQPIQQSPSQQMIGAQSQPIAGQFAQQLPTELGQSSLAQPQQVQPQPIQSQQVQPQSLQSQLAQPQQWEQRQVAQPSQGQQSFSQPQGQQSFSQPQQGQWSQSQQLSPVTQQPIQGQTFQQPGQGQTFQQPNQGQNFQQPGQGQGQQFPPTSGPQSQQSGWW